MKLIEHVGKIATVEIDGRECVVTGREYRKMRFWKFAAWPGELKRLNPAARSCARCLHRPIDFRHTNVRTVVRTSGYQAGVTDRMVFHAQQLDALYGTTQHEDALKTPKNKCPVSSWSRMAPFYSFQNCEVGEWEVSK